MTKKERAERNIGMTFDFIRQLIEDPRLLNTIADGAELDFVDKDMPSIREDVIRGRKVSRYKVEHVFEPIES